MELTGAYNPHEVEKKLYSHWMEKDYFKVSIDREKKPFTILIPPPNVTGSLHMGHALDNTIQDIIIRFRRMEGYNALWIPGTDHAGIATQNIVEKELAKEGIKRKDLGREEFLKKIWEWKKKYGRNIVYQLQRLGVSCDWSRERFTMDEVCSKAVRTAFKKLFDRGLIYRDKYIINWCPRCQTAISDLEVHHIETEGNLYYIRYPFKNGKGEIVLATTRPETMLGDTAVAVNPEDERYKEFIGEILILPLINREIPVIKDNYVEPSFGTGAVKITPAHDPNDFLVGLRHKLEQIPVIGETGNMTENAGPYRGLSREECRKKIIEDLKSQGFLIKIDPYLHSIGSCYRCNTSIEPFISEQWFCKMNVLAEPAIKAVKEGRTKFFPEKYKDTYLYWMENIKDWCISRQLWWGHRIPVWYCSDCNNNFSSIENPEHCSKCSGKNITQDNDVLDTWFSSGLWPLSTMKWPDEQEDIKYFYPTSVLVTARDIIFLWVARMMIMGLEFTGEVPFRHVFIHSTILNKEGRRMSKSLGTGVDPLDLIDKYGADATRFGLTFMTAQGQDVKFTEERLEMSRNFANKIWNASRFILMNLQDFSPEEYSLNDLTLNISDKWILSRYFQLVKKVTKSYSDYEFSYGAKEIYEFLWDEFCDWYIEISKQFLYGKEENIKKSNRYILWYIMTNTLKLLHPIMPFITEEIWSHMGNSKKSLIFSSWPQVEESFINREKEKDMELLIGIIKTIRTLRGEISIAPSKDIEIYIEAKKEDDLTFIEEHKEYIQTLAKSRPLTVKSSFEEKIKNVFTHNFQGIDIHMPFGELIDVNQELQKLYKERDKLEKEFNKINNKLSQKDFMEKAPKAIIEKEIDRKNDLNSKIDRVILRIKLFEGR